MNNNRSFLSTIPPVVKNLIAINIILWLACEVSPALFDRWNLNLDLRDILGMHYWAASKFNPAQFITYMFIHGGFDHVLFNMLSLFIFGIVLERVWGSKRFLFYYLITGIGAGIVQQIFWEIEYHSLAQAINDAIAANSGKALLPYENILNMYFEMRDWSMLNSPEILKLKLLFLNLPLTIGASGSIFGLLLAFGWLFPEERLFLMFIPIPIKARIFVVLYAFAELFLGVSQFSGDNIAHFAHLGGMLFGILIILYWKKKRIL